MAGLPDAQEHAITLTFGILGVIQGLAFTKLAEGIPKLRSMRGNSQQICTVLHFTACLMIVIRVFQTYAAGAFSYEQLNVGLADVLSIFGVGLLQYWIFDALDRGPAVASAADGSAVDATALHLRIAFLAGAAILLHGRTAYQEAHATPAQQTFVQQVNISVAVLIALICVVSLLALSRRERLQALISALVAAMLACNIAFSLHNLDLAAKPEPLTGRQADAVHAGH